MFLEKITLYSRSTGRTIEFWDERLLLEMFKYNICSYDYEDLARGIIIDGETHYIYKLTSYQPEGFTKPPSNKSFASKGFQSDTSTFYRNNYLDRIMRWTFLDVNVSNSGFHFGITQRDDLLEMYIQTSAGEYYVEVSVNGLISNGLIEVEAYDPRFKLLTVFDYTKEFPMPAKIGRYFFDFAVDDPRGYFGEYDYASQDLTFPLVNVPAFAEPTITIMGSLSGVGFDYLGQRYDFDYPFSDIMIIDCLAKTVEVDGTLVDYIRAFPIISSGNSSILFDLKGQVTPANIQVTYPLSVMVVD